MARKRQARIKRYQRWHELQEKREQKIEKKQIRKDLKQAQKEKIHENGEIIL